MSDVVAHRPPVIIRGGAVVDGTGRARWRADVAISAGRITAIGGIGAVDGAVEIDASGCVVAPGFIDVHTHYDAQAFWDPTLSPSPLHGVTTVVGGNCGFSIAPLTDDPGDAAYLQAMLARVEGIPLETLDAGVPFDWSTTASYLDRLDGALSVNAGFMVGHSAVRRAVMGPEAVERVATPAEVDAMVAMVRAGLAAGALGFSSSWSRTHNDGDGRPVPSRHADADELLALCRVCREFPGASIEFIPNVAGSFDDDSLELMTQMSLAAGSPLNWNVLPVTAQSMESVDAKLAAGEYAAERGGRVVALTVPMTVASRLSFRTGFLLDAMPGWEEILFLPHDEKRRALNDPAVRDRLRSGAASPQNPLPHVADWANKELLELVDPALASLAGRVVGDLAGERGDDPFDTLLDVVVADDLRTTFGTRVVETLADWKARAAVWRGGHAIVGASDAGAHLDLFASFQYPTVVLAEAVRKHGVVTLEEAVALLTSAPAALYGMHDRGVLRPGAHADIVIFSEDDVDTGPVHTRHDLPGGAGRLYADSVGVHTVLVGGVPIVDGGSLTGATPGSMLRSGVDTLAPQMTVPSASGAG